ncbi:DUF2807 domain-containing protein [Luteimonas yindakuii]|uniref:DUF2807 domain-containing protein n=1 Tax=Luteimonas yindakuii TaxID=2565782 RepID=UPI001FC9A24C|nr:DUF2807 domain-containing protein [Luteimonas yindakuii]
MKAIATLLVCLLPVAGFAQERCAHSQPQQLVLDTAGAKRVMFDIGPHRLRLQGSSGGDHRIAGRACASSEGDLARMSVTQELRGDTLHVKLQREDRRGLSLGDRYAYLTLEGTVPEDVLVQLRVGSGDAWLDGAASASADLGSGDVDVRGIRGLLTAKVGSGDAALHDVGALNVLSLGSGDIEASQVRGDAEVGSIGSGDFSLRGAAGNVDIGSIGSGDATLEDVTGNVVVGSIG